MNLTADGKQTDRKEQADLPCRRKGIGTWGGTEWSNHQLWVSSFEQGIHRPAHRHDAAEILYLPKGHAFLTADGVRRTISGRACQILQSGQIHSFFCPPGCAPLVIHVNEEYLASRLDFPQDRRFFSARPGRTPHPVLPAPAGPSCGAADNGEVFPSGEASLFRLFDELSRLLKKRPRGFGLLCESLILRILFILLDRGSLLPGRGFPSEPPRDRDRIRDILSYISEHYDRPITLEELSGRFGLSSDYFSRFFSQKVGISFKKHLSQVRLAHIYDDLLSSDSPIMEIAQSHGFTNYKLFNRLFREMYGASPRELRSRFPPGPDSVTE